MPYCPQCGSEVQAEDKFCASCGSDVAAIGVDTAPGGADDADAGGAAPGETSGVDDGSADETGGETDASAAGDVVEADAAEDDRRIDIPEDLFESDVFEFTFKYPIAEGWKPVLIGMALTLGSFLLFPLVLLVGYSFRLGRAAAVGRPRPPAYGDWWGLFVDGIRVIAAFLVFLVPVGLVFVGLAAVGLDSLAVVWYFAMSLVASAVFPILYGTGSVKATFADFEFLRFAATVDYWIGYAYLLGVILALYIGMFVLFFLLFITIVGILLIIPLTLAFYPALAYAQAALWGRVYHDAAEKGVVDEPRRPEELSGTW